MPGRLQSEIRQSRPFPHPADEAFLNLLRTADWLLQPVEEILRSFGLTHPQYNVLRILAGAGAAGLPCGEISKRLITRDPDITRLLDRMQKLGHVERGRGIEDRRVVRAHITRLGPDKLEQLTGILEDIRIQIVIVASK